MKTGLLWFDDDPRKQLEEKVRRAAAHYERKYGRAPTLCFVHPSVLNNSSKRSDGNGKRGKQSRKQNAVNKVGGVEIRTGRSVLPDHFWLGVSEDKGGQDVRTSGRTQMR